MYPSTCTCAVLKLSRYSCTQKFSTSLQQFITSLQYKKYMKKKWYSTYLIVVPTVRQINSSVRTVGFVGYILKYNCCNLPCILRSACSLAHMQRIRIYGYIQTYEYACIQNFILTTLRSPVRFPDTERFLFFWPGGQTDVARRKNSGTGGEIRFYSNNNKIKK